MKLGEFLTNIPPATGSGKKEQVEFTVMAKSTVDASLLESTAFACFALVSDREQEEADLEALKSMQDISKTLGIIPSAMLETRERAELLLRAIRDYDDPRQRFASTAEDLQRHLPRFEMVRLKAAYDAWVTRWYPKRITPDERAQLKSEAVGK